MAASAIVVLVAATGFMMSVSFGLLLLLILNKKDERPKAAASETGANQLVAAAPNNPPSAAKPNNPTQPTATQPSNPTQPAAAKPNNPAQPAAAKPSNPTQPAATQPSNPTQPAAAQPSNPAGRQLTTQSLLQAPGNKKVPAQFVSSSGSYGFSPALALKELNGRRAAEGLKPLVLDAALSRAAQARADKGIYPHDTDDYLKERACECLAAECSGSGDDVVRWALYKLWDFEKAKTSGKFAPGSPCYAIIQSDQHYKILSGRGGCAGGTVGFGVGRLKQMNGAPPPSNITHLVVIWIK